MKKHLPLTKIGFFNPGRLSDNEIELTFIARRPFFKYILKKITAEEDNSIPQHHLIIGQRGMGKSSLLTRIAAEIRKPEYSSRFIPLSFPEEQYNLDRLSKFWLNCLDSLADVLDYERKKEDLELLEKEIGQLSKNKELTADLAWETFKKWSKRVKRRPILLLDNLNLIFSKISIEEQHKLRGVLIEPDAPILVCTSAATIPETIDYQAPFYDAFSINYLKKLSFEESMEVLENLAIITGHPNFVDVIRHKKGRIEAMYQLTGGTPRTLAILFPLIQDGFSEDIQGDLDALLDMVTPLYKARFEELPDQQQVILDAIALNWDPVNLEDLREKTMLDNAKLSPQLKRLVDLGWIEKLKTNRKGGDSYELSERFFNVWYLMRTSSRRQKKELYCLTKFLEAFYGADLRNIAHSRISCKNQDADHIALDLALADAIQEVELSEKLRNKGYDELIDLSLEDDRILKDFSIPEAIAEQKVMELFKSADEKRKNKDYSGAKDSVNKILRLSPDNEFAWMHLGLLERALKNLDESESAFQNAVKLAPDKAITYWGLAKTQSKQGKTELALQSFNRTISLDPGIAAAWTDFGDLFNLSLHKYREAEEAYMKAHELAPEQVMPLLRIAGIYKNQYFDFKSAEGYYKQVLKIEKNNTEALYRLTQLYDIHLGEPKKAIKYILRAIKIAPAISGFWLALGNLYADYPEHLSEAESALQKAIEISPDEAKNWVSLGNFYRIRTAELEKAEEAYLKALNLDPTQARFYASYAMLNIAKNDLLKAEENFNKALSIDPKNQYALGAMAEMYIENLQDFEKGIEILKLLSEAKPESRFVWENLGNLYMKAKRFEDSEQAFRKAISINGKSKMAWIGLGILYHYDIQNYKEAERAYKFVIKHYPDEPFAHKNLGLLYAVTDRDEEAIKELKLALDIDGDDALGWDFLGSIYEENDKPDLAAEAYRKAIAIDGELATAYASLAYVLMDMDSTPEEIESLIVKATELSPESENYFQLGSFLSTLPGRVDEAIEAYQKALEKDPDNLTISNLTFLLRDEVGKFNEAKEIFSKIDDSDTDYLESILLNKALFSYYEKNIGDAEKSIGEAFEWMDTGTETHSLLDWYKAISVIKKLGYLDSLANAFFTNGQHIIQRPLFEAIQALRASDPELYLNSIASEIREPANQIIINIISLDKKLS